MPIRSNRWRRLNCRGARARAGDKILQINGQDIEDVLDYRFYIQNEEIDMVVQKRTAQRWSGSSIRTFTKTLASSLRAV
ncbi:MAG: PDZ domain-containing protein [Lachnospiraceae bacterium]